MKNITKDAVVALLDKKFIRVYDLQYAPGKHYYDASRRKAEDLIAVKSDVAFKEMTADAVTCIVICRANETDEPRLLLSYEYRYPAGRFLLSPPAGLMDEADLAYGKEAPIVAAKREIREETGLAFAQGDTIEIVNPLLFSSPGLTDESNAIVCMVKNNFREEDLSQAGAVGTECFDGFALLTREDALQTLKSGTDSKGFFYSAYTWMALLYFVHVFATL